MEFDAHAYVELDNPKNSLSIKSSFKIECLIYPTSRVQSDQYIVCGDPALIPNAAAPYVQITRDLKVAAGFGNGNALIRCETKEAVIAPAVWSRVTVIYDAAATSDNLTILINHQRVATIGGSVSGKPYGSNIRYVGGAKGVVGFVGIIDGLRIHAKGNALVGDWPFNSVDYVDYSKNPPLTPDTSSYKNRGRVFGAKLVPSSSPASADTAGALQIDPNGLSIYSGLLDFLRLSSAPCLLNGADGLLHLYCRDKDGWFSVAQCDAEAARSVFESGWAAKSVTGQQTGSLRFVAARSGTFMNESTIQIGPSALPELCDVVLDNQNGRKEVWRGIPRSLDTFLAVLNGQTTSDPNDPHFSSGQIGFYDNKGLYPVCRTSASSDEADVSVAFLSRFPATLPLYSVAVTDVNNETCTVVVQYNAMRWKPFAPANIITQAWRNVPSYARGALSVLNGLSGEYDYTPTDKGMSTAYKLSTSAPNNQDGEHEILIFTREGVSNFQIGVTNGKSQELCNVHASLKAGGATYTQQWNDIPRSQGVFAAALEKGGPVSDYILVLTDGMEAYVRNHAAVFTKSAVMLAWASLFKVYNDGLLRGDEKLKAQSPVAAAILQKSFYVENGHETLLPDGSTLFGALAYNTPTNGGVAMVGDTAAYTNGDANLIIPAINGGWLRESPRKALQFSGANAVGFDTSHASINELAIADDMTVALWCQPNLGLGGGSAVRLLDFNRKGNVNLPDELIRYCIGLVPAPCLRLGGNTQIASGYTPSSLAPEVTLQVLVNPDVGTSGRLLRLQSTPSSSPKLPPPPPTPSFFQLRVDAQQYVSLFYLDDIPLVTSKQPLQTGQWQQVTATLRNLPGKTDVEIRLYVDGFDQGSKTLPRMVPPLPNMFFVGSTTDAARGYVNGVFLWNRALTEDEVKKSFARVVAPDESGLVIAWYLTEGSGNKVTNRAIAGTVLTSTVENQSKDLWFVTGVYSVPFAGNRDYMLKAPSGLLLGSWRQLSSVYRTGHAVRFSSGNFADCGRDASQNLDTTLSLEAWIQADRVGSVQSVVSKYGAYEIELGADNAVVFRFWTEEGVVERRSATKVQAGVPYYVAATVDTGANKTESTTDPQKTPPTFFVKAQLYVNADLSATFTQNDYAAPVSIASSNSRLTFGMNSRGGASYSGYLSDVRLWERVLTEDEVRETYRKHFAPRRQDGLISSWNFSEMTGKVAFDVNNLNNAILTDNDLWSIFSPSASLTLLVDGEVQEDVVALRPADVGGYGAEQFTVGALKLANGSFGSGLRGQLDEVRIWNKAKTAEEISDDAQRTLFGSEEGLAGYWKFDNGSGTTIDDETGRANDGTLLPSNSPPVWVNSTAPVSNEAREVYDVLGGLRTPFQRRISGAPSIVEYADTQRDAYGQLFSVIKRCYVSNGQGIEQGAVNLVTGYKVDDLETVYAGQVQTKPTLVGFVEGAPPVPSENQTQPFWADKVNPNGYAGCASVQLEEADSEVMAYSGSENKGDATTISGQVGLYLSTGASWSVGVGVQTSLDVFNAEGHIGYQGETQAGTQAGQELGFSYGKMTTFTDAVAPGGAWEDAGALLNPEVGRRHVPLNTGYALVKSLTADLYMVRLKGARTVVKFNIIPNPDIPEDVNIIEFPINPQYTKNGTLDGMVGFVPDPDYPAASLAPGSYFRPLEAYRLKRQVEKQDKQLEAYFRQFDTARLSRGLSISNVGMALNKNARTDLAAFREKLADSPSYDWQRRLARRNLVNIYVWTAGGGLHSEQQSMIDTFTESYTGLSTWSADDGLHIDAAAAEIVGVYGEFDALFSATLEVSSMKSSESDDSYGLGVEIKPEWFLRCPLIDGNGQPNGYAPTDTPGKVNAYRFMSFFLAPSEDNFDVFFRRVVDATWLQNSANPNAAALREASVSTNGAWRILHRVTYVSRVPQQFTAVPAENFAPNLTPPVNLANNIVITRLVERKVGVNVHNPAPVDIGAAIDAVLGASASKPGKLGVVLPWWADFLLAAADVRGEAYRALLALRSDLLEYMIQKYAADAYAA